MDTLSKTINTLINFLFKGLVLTLPLFFLPWTTTLSGMDNFNKQNLLLAIVDEEGDISYYEVRWIRP